MHERPIISRVVSLDHPMEIKEGMVFALETYCPAKDGYSAARIEEEIVVTNKGGVVISLFPAETCRSALSIGVTDRERGRGEVFPAARAIGRQRVSHSPFQFRPRRASHAVWAKRPMYAGAVRVSPRSA